MLVLVLWNYFTQTGSWDAQLSICYNIVHQSLNSQRYWNTFLSLVWIFWHLFGNCWQEGESRPLRSLYSQSWPTHFACYRTVTFLEVTALLWRGSQLGSKMDWQATDKAFPPHRTHPMLKNDNWGHYILCYWTISCNEKNCPTLLATNYQSP